jgi:hypothetical protein
MAHYAGDLLRETFTLLNPDQSPITGATFTIDISTDPNGSTFDANVVVTELGSGAYKVEYQTTTTSPTGHYYVLVRYDGSLDQVFEIEWDLEPVALQSIPTQASISNGPTLREIRRAVLKLIGDLTITTATATSTSSQWTDLDNIVGGAGSYASYHLHVTGGTAANLGQFRRVSGSSSAGTLQLARELPVDVAIGDEAELLNTQGVGITFQDVQEQILHSIAIAKPTVPISYDVTGVFDPASRAIAIPDDFYAIDGLSYRFDTSVNNSWNPMQPANARGASGWWVEDTDRTIYIGDLYGYTMRNANVRITGIAAVTPPENDTDIVAVDREWITYRTAADLALRPLRMSSNTNNDNLQRLGVLWDERATRLRDKTRHRPRAGRRMLV